DLPLVAFGDGEVGAGVATASHHRECRGGCRQPKPDLLPSPFCYAKTRVWGVRAITGRLHQVGTFFWLGRSSRRSALPVRYWRGVCQTKASRPGAIGSISATSSC